MLRAALFALALLVAISGLTLAEDKPLTEEQKKRVEELVKQLAQKREEIAKIEAELNEIQGPPKLVGTWVTIEEHRSATIALKGKDINYRGFIFGKTAVSISIANRNPGKSDKKNKDGFEDHVVEYSYLYDDSKKPPELRILHKDGEGKLGTSYYCICKMEGETLVLAFNSTIDAGFLKNPLPPRSFEPVEKQVTVLKLIRKK
jgi:hypothetical protein